MTTLSLPKAARVPIGRVGGQSVELSTEWQRFFEVMNERAGNMTGTAQDVPVAVALLNSWANFGAPYGAVSYYRDQFGVVRLSGVMKSGAIGSVAFNLPANCRPSNTMRFAVESNCAFGYVTVSAAGDVVPAGGSNVSFSLDGVSFMVAQ